MHVAIVFGSETGNTKEGASIVAQALTADGHKVDLLDVGDTHPNALLGDFGLVLLGVSTWGAVAEEVQQDFVELYDAMAGMDLSGHRVAVFGSGDKGYDEFAKAVDFVENRAKERGASVAAPGFKYHLEPAPVRTELEAWARQAVQAAGS